MNLGGTVTYINDKETRVLAWMCEITGVNLNI